MGKLDGKGGAYPVDGGITAAFSGRGRD